MPTDRPRHVITETEAVAAALDDAAGRWPEERDNRQRLLLRLIEEGRRAVRSEVRVQEQRRSEALQQTSGAVTGAYGPGYLEALRGDWPG